MDRISGIYNILCLTNQKIYIGSSKNIGERLRIHERDIKKGKHHSVHLQRAWNQYGKESFEYFCIEKSEIEFLIEREQYWMDKYESYNKNKGYNINRTAGSCLGNILSEEHKKKISLAHKGKIIPKSVREKISKTHKENPYWKDKNHKESTIEKIRQSKTGLKQSKDLCEKKNDSIRSGGARTGLYKGVCWDKSKNRWCAQIKYNGKNIHLGRFVSEVEAAHNYDYHLLSLHNVGYRNFPEFDYTNFVPKKELGI
jgi:group I intron endonuclease